MGGGASLAKDSQDATDAQLRSVLGELSSAERAKVEEALGCGKVLKKGSC